MILERRMSYLTCAIYSDIIKNCMIKKRYLLFLHIMGCFLFLFLFFSANREVLDDQKRKGNRKGRGWKGKGKELKEHEGLRLKRKNENWGKEKGRG